MPSSPITTMWCRTISTREVWEEPGEMITRIIFRLLTGGATGKRDQAEFNVMDEDCIRRLGTLPQMGCRLRSEGPELKNPSYSGGIARESKSQPLRRSRVPREYPEGQGWVHCSGGSLALEQRVHPQRAIVLDETWASKPCSSSGRCMAP